MCISHFPTPTFDSGSDSTKFNQIQPTSSFPVCFTKMRSASADANGRPSNKARRRPIMGELLPIASITPTFDPFTVSLKKNSFITFYRFFQLYLDFITSFFSRFFFGYFPGGKITGKKKKLQTQLLLDLSRGRWLRPPDSNFRKFFGTSTPPPFPGPPGTPFKTKPRSNWLRVDDTMRLSSQRLGCYTTVREGKIQVATRTPKSNMKSQFLAPWHRRFLFETINF